MDLISELPEAILHYILYSLPSRDLARSSVLSKAWRSISSSCPTVSLFQKYFHENDFSDFMKLCLQNFVTKKLGVRRFKLYITNFEQEDLSCLIDQWINFVTNRRLEEVSIEIPNTSNGKVCYNLPAGILLSSNTLTTLSLSGCGLENYYSSNSISLPNLQNLALQHMDVDVTFVQNLLLSCPLLEHIIINRCNKLTSLEISSSLQRLRTLGVEFCFKLGKIVVGTGLSLESLRFSTAMPCEMINLAASDSLKSISLRCVLITSEWLQNQITRFVGLEHLYLSQIKNLETIKISSPKLNKLEIFHCMELGAATEIDAPNLHEVEFTENMLPFYSIRSSNLGKASFYFSLGDHDKIWIHKLQELFQTTSHIQDFKVAILYYINMNPRVITTKLSDSVVVMLKEMVDPEIGVEITSMSSPKWFDHLLSECPLEKMYVATYDHESIDFLSAFYEEVSNKRAEAEASRNTSSMNKCNHYYLDDVEIGSINWAEEKEKNEDEIEGWISLLKAYEKALYSIITMKLKWSYRQGPICSGEWCRQCRE